MCLSILLLLGLTALVSYLAIDSLARGARQLAAMGETVNLVQRLNIAVKTMVDAPTDYLGTRFRV